MKAYLWIASEKEDVTQERYNALLENYKKVAKEYEISDAIYRTSVKHLKDAYEKCLQHEYEYELKVRNYLLKDNEILNLAQCVFSLEDLAKLQMNEVPYVSHYTEYNEGTLIRNGIIHEVKKEYYESYHCYYAANSKAAFERAYFVKKKLEKENHSNYSKGMKFYQNKDYQNAYYPLMLAADHGDLKASMVFAEMNIKGLGCVPSIKEGLMYLERKILLLSSRQEALKVVSRLYKEGYLLGYLDSKKIAFYNDYLKRNKLDTRDYKVILKEKAEAGNLYCMMRLAKEALDTKEKIHYYQMASEQKDPDAYYQLAMLLPKEKDHYLELAAKAGNVEACYDQMKKYANDFDKKMEYAKIAADKQDGLGSLEYAKMLEMKGLNSVPYYELAADKGMMEAMLRLAKAYQNGELGLEIDQKKASMYLFKAGIGRE